MIKNKYCFTAILLLAVAACAGLFTAVCRDAQSGQKDQKLTVVTSFYPIYVAAANVAGDCAGIEVMNLSEPQTGCLHDFQMTPEDMKLLSRADIFLVNGGGMESFLTDVAERYPDLPVVEAANGLFLPDGNAHAWMSVSKYRQMVDAIAGQLSGLSAEHAKEIENNASDYDQKLEALEERLEELKSVAKGQKILSFHEAYEYLADDYGLEIVYALNLDEEGQVGAKEIKDAVSSSRENGAPAIFAEELYGRKLAQTVQKETGAKICYLNTLTRGEYDLDSYIDGMRENMDILYRALKKSE